MEFIKQPELNISARSIKIISLFGLVLGSVFLMASIKFNWPQIEVLTLSGIVFLSIFLLIIAESLLKGKKWAWYAAMIFSALGLISTLFIPLDFKFFVGVISFLIGKGLMSGMEEILK